jgi:hypothetical protein
VADLYVNFHSRPLPVLAYDALIGERWAAIASDRSGLVLPPTSVNPITERGAG